MALEMLLDSHALIIEYMSHELLFNNNIELWMSEPVKEAKNKELRVLLWFKNCKGSLLLN